MTTVSVGPLPPAALGRRRRMSRLFGADGRTLIVGFDHAVSAGTFPGLANTPEATADCLRGGVDAIQVGLNAARWITGAAPQVPLVVRLDQSDAGDDPRQRGCSSVKWGSVEEAVQLAAEAVVVNYVHDVRDVGVSHQHAELLGEVAAECHRFGMPLFVEVFGKTDLEAPDDRTRVMVDSGRIAFELGADCLKIDFFPTAGGVRELSEAVPIPLLIRGGAPVASWADATRMLRAAIDEGAAGAVYGRTVWQADDVEDATRRLAAVIHAGD